MENTEPTIKTLGKDVGVLKLDVGELKSDVKGLKVTVDGLKVTTENIQKDLTDLKITVSDIKNFMREHLVTRTDLVLFEERLDKKFAKQETLDKLYNSFDNFAKETLKEREEHSVKNYRLKNLELWAEKTGIKIDLPYKI